MIAEPSFPDYPPTVPHLLQAGRERFGDRECVVTPEDRMTYADLDERSRRLAARLVELGVGKSSRVAVLFPNGADWVVAWAAAARLGCVVVPVNTFYQAPELGRFLRHADVQYLLGVDSFLHHDYLARLETVAPELAGATAGADPNDAAGADPNDAAGADPNDAAGADPNDAAGADPAGTDADAGPARRPLFLPSLPQLRRVLLWGPSSRPWADGDLASAVHAEPSTVAAGLVYALGADVAADDPMLITYTSGSTGDPKGVVQSHGALIRQASNLSALSGIDADSRIWTPMPLCWVGGFAFSLLRALVRGGCFITQEVFDAGEALKTFERERVTNVSAWPGVTKSLTEHPAFASTDLSSLRSGTSFYDAVPPEKRPPDPGLAVTSLGMSETCGPHTFWTPEEEVTGAPEEYRGNFGHEVPGTEHRIVDPETNTDLPPGQEGEVLVRGYNLMLGLYKQPRSEVFDPDGWYRTGDRGYFRDGWFFFTGRQSDLIKTSGSNVAPAEVEMALMGFGEVKLAFVVGTPHPDRGQDVVALVVPWRVDPAGQALDPPDGDALRLRLRDQVSSYKVPRHLFVIEDADVPWLLSQKVDRRALVAMAEKLVAAT